MKLLLILLIVATFAGNVKAQDSVSVDSKSMNKTTLTFQPIIGLGLLNGGRIGIGVKLNEIVTMEATAGLDFPASVGVIFFFLPIDMRGRTLSQGIIVTPFNEKRFSLILYNTINSNDLSSMSAWQAMAGWKIQTGETTTFRMSAGYAKQYAGKSDNYSDIMIGLDFVLTIYDFKVTL